MRLNSILYSSGPECLPASGGMDDIVNVGLDTRTINAYLAEIRDDRTYRLFARSA